MNRRVVEPLKYTFQVCLLNTTGEAVEPLNSIPAIITPILSSFPKVKSLIKRDWRAAEPLQIKYKLALLKNTAIKECAWAFNETHSKTTPFVSFL